jgi:homocysteine S-methyltransferase
VDEDEGVGLSPVALTDGGLETSLIFKQGFDLPCFASFPLLETDVGRQGLRRYFTPFLDLAEERGMPFVLDTATWRANPERGERLGYTHERLAQVNRDAVGFARSLAAGRSEVTINGALGPRGDGYVIADRMSEDEAERYHARQIAALRDGGVEHSAPSRSAIPRRRSESCARLLIPRCRC